MFLDFDFASRFRAYVSIRLYGTYTSFTRRMGSAGSAMSSRPYTLDVLGLVKLVVLHVPPPYGLVRPGQQTDGCCQNQPTSVAPPNDNGPFC